MTMTLRDALARLAPHLDDAVCVHANGFLSRAAFGTRDTDTCFYMIGSMGLASSIGLGIALARPDRRVIVLDGDGNVLMNLGTLATIGHRAVEPPAPVLRQLGARLDGRATPDLGSRRAG